MALVINTNVASLNAQRNLESSQSLASTSLERLSSGLRINSARDDAAGLAISNRLTTQINGLNQAARNAGDGISLSQTAEGALGEVSSNLQRIRELSVQSANGTLSGADRTALQTEVTALVAEIDRVATQTSFNGLNLLDGNFTSVDFQVGANVGETVTVASIASARSSSLGQFQGFVLTDQSIGVASDTPAAQSVTVDGNTVSLGTIANDARAVSAALNASGLGFAATADATSVASATTTVLGSAADADVYTINGVAINITNTGVAASNEANAVAAINAQSAATGVVATDDGTGVALSAADGRNITTSFVANGGAGSATVADYGFAADGTTGATVDVNFVAGAGVTGNVTFTGAFNPGSQAIGAAGTALSTVDISTVAGALTGITAIDSALASISTTRAELGAVQNRFESVISSTRIASENAEASRSRILDADFAAETANLTKSQILTQAGISVLAQANAQPQQVLALLQ
jgi:flagellin